MSSLKPKIRVPDDIVAHVRKLHPHIKKKFRNAFEMILDNPLSGKALKEEFAGLRSFRVGRYRVIYRLSVKGNIEVIAIGPRKTIYLETYRKLFLEGKEGFGVHFPGE